MTSAFTFLVSHELLNMTRCWKRPEKVFNLRSHLSIVER